MSELRSELVFEEHLGIGKRVGKLSMQCGIVAWWLPDLGVVLFERDVTITRWFCESSGSCYDVDNDLGGEPADVRAVASSVRLAVGNRLRILEARGVYVGRATRVAASESDELQRLAWVAFLDAVNEY